MTLLAMALRSPTITIQEAGGSRREFRVGEAAVQLETKLSHCELWMEDLGRWLYVIIVLAFVTMFCAAFCVAAYDADAWPIVSLQGGLALLGPLWRFALWWRSARVLKWTLYATVTALAISSASFLLWLTIFTRAREEAAGLWWLPFAFQALEVLTVLCAAKALANIYDARLISDLNVTMDRAVASQTRRHRELCAPGIGSGAAAMSDIPVGGRRERTDKKVVDVNTKNK